MLHTKGKTANRKAGSCVNINIYIYAHSIYYIYIYVYTYTCLVIDRFFLNSGG